MTPKERKQAVAQQPSLGLTWIVFIGALIASFALTALGAFAESTPNPGIRSGTDYLAGVMDQFHRTFYVYDDYLSAGNHFNERGRMCNPGDETSVPPMKEDCTRSPYSGLTCIQCNFKSSKNSWGGWFFMNGALQADDSVPSLNWGDVLKGGYDLRGATRLTFWARGEKGGEKVMFQCFGLGRQPFTGKAQKPHPDSSPKLTTGYLTLSKDWKQYSLNLQGLELQNVLLGFSWQTKSTINRHQDITFYLDEISYDKPRLNEPRLLTSYETANSDDDFDIVMRNTAFVYDNALALMAFLGSGDLRRAKLIADALVYAQQHDRTYSDGRLRNAYCGGDLRTPPGFEPGGQRFTARLPGWWDSRTRSWNEDRAMVGSYAGNMAWAMLALLAYYEVSGGDQYLESAERMGRWIDRHCRDHRGNGGFTGGYEGWEPRAEKLQYKSTEHNIDLFAAYRRLYLITGEPGWNQRARHARRFVVSMWDPLEGKFWTGTGDDGKTVFKEVIPLDAQAWGLLALRNEGLPLMKGLQFAEAQMTVGKGFDFNEDADGVWFEGTAQMAAAFAFSGQRDKHRQLVSFLKASQAPTGGLYASDRAPLRRARKILDSSSSPSAASASRRTKSFSRSLS